MKTLLKLFSVITIVISFVTIGCDKPKTPDSTCNVDNPLTDLPWLKTKIEELTLLYQDNPLSVAIYQCTYSNGQTGFLEERGNIAFFYNCKGETLCTMGGVVGETCPELNIDFANGKLIWYVENGFVNGVCEFDNPLEDLSWLKNIVEEFTAYSTSNQRSFKIYQCTYIKRNDEKTGFIVTPICVDCDDDTAMLYSCTGVKLCSMGGILGTCDDFNIANKKLIWESN
jgi:hypothetical protein